MNNPLYLKDITYSFPEIEWKINIPELKFGDGEFIGIAGPNGSGKSTLLRLASGIILPDTGDVFLNGDKLEGKSRKEIARQIGYLTQNASGGENFTVSNIVSLGRFAHTGETGFLTKKDNEVIQSAMETTDTYYLAERYFRTLSGGEKQRVLLASVIAQEPKILLLDEPESALDYRHKARFFNLLSSLSEKGLTVIIVTHDINAASSFCDRLILMNDGKIIDDGKPAEVLSGENLTALYGNGIGRIINDNNGNVFVFIKKNRDNK